MIGWSRMHRDEWGEGGGPDDEVVVLFVEDEFLIRMASADWLRDAGFEVIEAADGHEALAVLSSDRPLDIMATDVNLAGGPNGVELACRAGELRPGMPVVLVSAHLPQDKAVIVGAFVQKPYGPAELVQSVRRLVGDSRASRRA